MKMGCLGGGVAFSSCSDYGYTYYSYTYYMATLTLAILASDYSPHDEGDLVLTTYYLLLATYLLLTTDYSPHDEGDLVLVHGAEARCVVVGLGRAARVGAWLGLELGLG